MFHRLVWVPLAVSALTSASLCLSQVPHSPYKGEEKRKIKALSDGQIESLLKGEGMGLARAAELNRYPGPKHVLELKEALKLTPVQLRKTRKAFDVMHAEACELGRRIVEAEARLDAVFAKGAAKPSRIAELTSEIGRLNGKLRLCHLKAHLVMMDVLSKWQVEEYSKLRGYDAKS